MPSTHRPVSDPAPSSAAMQAWIALMRTQKRLLDLVEGDLKRAGLPPLGWYDVLLELWRAEGGRLRPLDIEKRTLLAQYNLSRLLARLEREGLIGVEADPEDGRGKWAVITSDGLAVREAMWAVYADSIREHVQSKLSDDEATRLGTLLERIST